MAADPWMANLVTWVLTYLLHSTILLSAAWVITSLLPSRADGLRETLWKFALVGGVVSASAQLCAAPRVGAWLGQMEIGDPWRVDVSALFPRDGADGAEAWPWSWTEGDAADDLDGAATVAPPPAGAPGDPGAPPSSPTTNEAIAGGAVMLLRTALAGAPIAIATVLGFSMLALGIGIARLRRLLGRRADVLDPLARQTLDELCRRAGVRRRVRLTHSPRLATPVAMGLLRGEICLPTRALAQLHAAELEGMIAHELAHVVRCDPLWMAVGQVISTVLFIQPLNAVARRRLGELAEYQCDAWAAAQCQDGLPLARCLTEVAMWLVQARRPAEARLLPGMSVRQSTLSRRVGRLLDEPPALPLRRPGMVLGALVMASAAAAVLSPRVQAVVDMDAIATRLTATALPPASAVVEAAMATSVADASAALADLDQELAGLQQQVDELAATIRGTPLEAELAPLLADFQRRAESIRNRRAALERLTDRARLRTTNNDQRPARLSPEPRER